MHSPQTVVNNVVSIWQEYFQSHPGQHNVAGERLEAGILNQMEQSNLLTVIFSFADLSILHINRAAADYFGATVEDIKGKGAAFIVSCFDDEQLKFAMNTAVSNAIETSNMAERNLLNTYTCYANWIINSKTGQRKRALFRIFPIQLNERGLPLTGMYLIHDIMPFLRDNVWWYRSVYGPKKFVYYHSDEKKIVRKDLLSDREKTILQYLSQGYSSKELGEHLNLSSHTVDNHRRRMLAKTGAVDSTALIHVARLSGLL